MRISSFLIFLFSTLTCYADEFNFGLGYIGFDVNHYRGSDQVKTYNLYVPYVYYQSNTFNADAAMINTRFIRSRFFSMQLSMGANPSVESKENKARQGMPELNYNFGLGPMAIIHILKDPIFTVQIEFSLRQEFETDFSFARAFGTTQTTYLTFKSRQATWSIELALGRMYADKSFHEYYYNVDPEYATADRPSYQAQGGYSGDVVIFSGKKKFGDFLIYPFARYDNLTDAVFVDSPLIKKKDYLMVGIGLFYLLF